MGDNRASIKIELTMYGHTETVDMWINWWPSGDYCVDRRIPEWFEQAVEKLKGKRDEDEWAIELERRKLDWTDGTWVPERKVRGD